MMKYKDLKESMRKRGKRQIDHKLLFNRFFNIEKM
jgi:hypothetical protein